MRTLLTLVNREIRAFFYQPVAYVVMFFVLIVAGFNFWFAVNALNTIPTEFTIVEIAFNMVPFWMTLILIFPLITMRTYSEEYLRGTFETLTTAPVHDWQVVASKFIGSLTFFCVIWAPTLLHFALFKSITNQDPATGGGYAGAYLLLLLMGMFFCAAGCLSSSLVKDQVNAAVICTCGMLVWFFFPFVPEITRVTNPQILDLFRFFSAKEHMMEFARGQIDTRPIIWYLTATVFLLVINLLVFQRRKWKA